VCLSGARESPRCYQRKSTSLQTTTPRRDDSGCCTRHIGVAWYQLLKLLATQSDVRSSLRRRCTWLNIKALTTCVLFPDYSSSTDVLEGVRLDRVNAHACFETLSQTLPLFFPKPLKAYLVAREHAKTFHDVQRRTKHANTSGPHVGAQECIDNWQALHHQVLSDQRLDLTSR
jgi:hypothetical protein